MPERGLERAVEVVLGIGLLASGLLLTGGLALGRFAPQRWGIIALMATPAMRLVVLTVGGCGILLIDSFTRGPSRTYLMWPALALSVNAPVREHVVARVARLGRCAQ